MSTADATAPLTPEQDLAGRLAGKRPRDLTASDYEFFLFAYRMSDGRPPTVRQLAEAMHVSRAAVYARLEKLGIDPKQKPSSTDDLIPWRVAPEHLRLNVIYLLRILARIEQGHEADLPPERVKAAKRFRQELADRGHVISYDPETGPRPVPRVEGVDEWPIPIQVPEALMNDLQRARWQRYRQEQGASESR